MDPVLGQLPPPPYNEKESQRKRNTEADRLNHAPFNDCACIFNLDNIFIGFYAGSIIVKFKVLTSIDEPDARLKAERIDLQIDEVQH